jgi:hypothetical protein
MPGPNNEPAKQLRLPPKTNEFSKPGKPASLPDVRADFDVERWALLVADGQVPFPTDLESSVQEALVRRVSQRRRLRLLKFIARAIAQDICRLRDS